MKKTNLFIVATIIFSLVCFPLKAKIIEDENSTKEFGDWKVYCQSDIMMQTSNCKIANKFYFDNSVISLEPQRKQPNILIVIPKVKDHSQVLLKVGQNQLIKSLPTSKNDFGYINFSPNQQKIIYNQMKNNDFLFLRFKVTKFSKAITVRLNLNDFREALKYYKSKT